MKFIDGRRNWEWGLKHSNGLMCADTFKTRSAARKALDAVTLTVSKKSWRIVKVMWHVRELAR